MAEEVCHWTRARKAVQVTSQLQAEASFPNKGLHLRPSAALGER